MSRVILLVCLLSSVQTVLSKCTVAEASEEKKYLDLIEPLNGKTFNVSDKTNNYTYTIRFCEAIQGLTDPDAGVEQYSLTSQKHVVVGRITTTYITAGSNWILLEYRNGEPYHHPCGQEPRRANIIITCNPAGLLVGAALIEENNGRDTECAYIFEVGSSVACNQTPAASSSGLSVGGVIVIVALSLAAAYVVFGVLYKRCVLGAKGREQFPNVAFWTNFGNLTADGCDFLCRCNKKEQSKSYKGLGDDQLGLDEEEERDDNILPMY